MADGKVILRTSRQPPSYRVSALRCPSHQVLRGGGTRAPARPTRVLTPPTRAIMTDHTKACMSTCALARNGMALLFSFLHFLCLEDRVSLYIIKELACFVDLNKETLTLCAFWYLISGLISQILISVGKPKPLTSKGPGSKRFRSSAH